MYNDNGLRHLHWALRCRRQLEVSQPLYIRQKCLIKQCLGDVPTVKFIAYISIKMYLYFNLKGGGGGGGGVQP